VAATLTITTQRPLILPPGGVLCLGPCINSVTVTPHGTFAGFEVKTDNPAHFEIQVSTAAPDANHHFSHVDSAMFNLSNVTDWSTNVFSLKPSTLYTAW